eukprot:6493898-Prymnesium_polylepis.1
MNAPAPEAADAPEAGRIRPRRGSVISSLSLQARQGALEEKAAARRSSQDVRRNSVEAAGGRRGSVEVGERRGSVDGGGRRGSVDGAARRGSVD